MTKKSKEGLSAKKEENFSEWFQQLIIKSELADYSPVSGCIVFRPASFNIWEKTKEVIDNEFKKVGIKNVYFPMFIPEKLLSKEIEHVKGFAPEVAWVTHAGNTKLNEKLAIRPTSEAIMYGSYSKWIRSWRNLPLKLNQWVNVVRWEFNNPIPFFRTREFLFNEGHNAYSNKKELDKDKDKITKIYSEFLKNYMALPSLLGKKTDKEKFAGAVATYSSELYLPNGKAIQGPDYHDDGQNFAKAYNIKFLDKSGKEQFAYQSTYAISTRMLGIMFAIHSDNKGLIIPPKLAENKIVIIPLMFEKNKDILKKARELSSELSRHNPIVDDRLEVTPGYKFNEWELKGIPLRIEIGPKDLNKKEVVVARRDNEKKVSVKIKKIEEYINNELRKMQETLFKKAQKLLNDNINKADNLKDAIRKINGKKIVLVPLKNSSNVEEILKEKTKGAKTLNIPEKQPKIKGKKCIISGEQADYWVYVGKSY
ncbi:MAG: proline--tRNA ligase [Candidatus Pacearchaeota archaeon]|jgi:prolyl-tRNA synthetase|nr:proline--tRNA ligase [Candidatus Pacearchaeota archaeon]MDP7520676.1 proline--tRNA ligase [Candidatus Pacearchaeota archaeon]|tara:strand:+ start:7598 stop:9040 length:1443 start_codon:yes stop_codon:yes gene_type:complete